jgi:hypothetical protein
MSAHAFAQSVGTAKELFQQEREVNTAHNQRGSAAVVKCHGVAIPEMGDHTCDDSLLTHPEVHLTGYLAGFPQLRDSFFEAPAPQHQAVKRPQVSFHEILFASYLILLVVYIIVGLPSTEGNTVSKYLKILAHAPELRPA